MVMHARKIPRIGDGYFEKNQSSPYESSNKYLKLGERNSDKSFHAGGNSDSSGKLESHNQNSPRCHKSYAQRLKDKDHHDDVSNKSPTMKSEGRSKDMQKNASSMESEGSSLYHSNHDRNFTEDGERRLQVGDWSEHISSSGKKYYYNCKTEVSQWEKPKELLELERQMTQPRGAPSDLHRSRDKGLERQNVASGSKNSHSQDYSASPDNSEAHVVAVGDPHHKNSYLPGGGTTAAAMASSHGGGSGSSTAPGATSSQVQPYLLSPSQVTPSNLPKLISQLAGTKGFSNLADLSTHEAIRTIQQALQLTKQVANYSHNEISIPKSLSPAHSQNQAASNHHSTQSGCSLTSGPNGSSSLLQHGDDKHDVDRASPGSDCSIHSSRHDSPTSSISSLQNLGTAGTSSLAALKPSIPSLTPSLANYYREELICHVVGWQADHAERQANRYWEEAHNIGSLSCTQVSAELKMSRALVRLAEIKTTLKEQRILFLRQQIKELEDWRSLNSFMSDS